MTIVCNSYKLPFVHILNIDFVFDQFYTNVKKPNVSGFPYWPAKGMSVSGAGLVDVRFFGAHDRAWVPARDCFLFCEKDPNNFRTKRQDILDSMQVCIKHESIKQASILFVLHDICRYN